MSVWGEGKGQSLPAREADPHTQLPETEEKSDMNPSTCQSTVSQLNIPRDPIAKFPISFGELIHI